MSDSEDTGWPEMLRAGGPHYVVEVVDFPPRSVTCKCGDVFSGPDPVAQITDHMEEKGDG